METKYLIFFAACLILIPAGVVFGCAFRVAREAMLFLLVLMTGLVGGRLDINFVSREFYRGTTRGFELSVLDMMTVALLVCALYVRARSRTKLYWPASLGAILVYVFYCGFNIAVSDPKLFGLFELSKILRGTLVFVAVALYVREERDLKVLLFGLCALMIYEGGVCLRERYGLGAHQVQGTLNHPNALSIYCCAVAPVLLAGAFSSIGEKLKKLCLLAAASASGCVILSISRAGFANILLVTAGTAVACGALRLSTKRLATTGLALVCVVFVLAKAQDTVIGRFKSRVSVFTELSGEGRVDRRVYWEEAVFLARKYPFGCGLNSWSWTLSKESDSYIPYDEEISEFRERVAAPAHTIIGLTLGELGVPGLLIFLALWGRWFQLGLGFLFDRAPDLSSRFGVGILFSKVGVFVQSMTEWMFRSQHVFFLFHILLGGMVAALQLRRQARSQRMSVLWSGSR